MAKKKSTTRNNPASSPTQSHQDIAASSKNDWRAQTLAHVRKLIQAADPEAVEEIKWRKPSNGMQGIPVWSHDGILCTGETYKQYVKLTFAKGASLADPSRLFNASLEGNTRRAIDIHEHDKLNEKAFKALIRAAVAFNKTTKTASTAIRSRKANRP